MHHSTSIHQSIAIPYTPHCVRSVPQYHLLHIFARYLLVLVLLQQQTVITMNLPNLSSRKAISQSFSAKAFTTSWINQNPHYQTIVGSGALRSKVFGQPPRPFEVTSEELSTPDGDSFLVEYTKNINDDKVHGIVIVLHGLESSSKSGLCTNLAIASMEKGFATCLFNFRGCHGIENK